MEIILATISYLALNRTQTGAADNWGPPKKKRKINPPETNPPETNPPETGPHIGTVAAANNTTATAGPHSQKDVKYLVEEGDYITLVAKNGEMYSVPWLVAKKSNYIRDMMIDFSDNLEDEDSDDEDQEIQFPDIDTETLGLVIKIMKDLAKPLHVHLAQSSQDTRNRVIAALKKLEIDILTPGQQAAWSQFETIA